MIWGIVGVALLFGVIGAFVGAALIHNSQEADYLIQLTQQERNHTMHRDILRGQRDRARARCERLARENSGLRAMARRRGELLPKDEEHARNRLIVQQGLRIKELENQLGSAVSP